jgi:hypothetical protein
MGRRTSGQITGLQSIGNVQASAATLSTSQTNQNLTIDPNGTGTVEVTASVNITGDMSITNQGDLRLLEASGNGTNYIAQQAAATMAANYTITWPAAVSGTSGFVLTSDTSGNLSWASAGGNIPVVDPGSSATVHYPFFGTAAGAVPTTLSPNARSNLSFVPSTGTLTTTVVSSGTISATASTASTGTGSGAIISGGGLGVAGRTSTADLTVTNTPIYPITENERSSSYTLALTDRNLVTNMNSGSALNVTIPADGTVNFPIGSTLQIYRSGTGTVQLVPAGGVTLVRSGDLSGAAYLERYEVVILRKRASNFWVAYAEHATQPTTTGGTRTVLAQSASVSFTSGSSALVVTAP